MKTKIKSPELNRLNYLKNRTKTVNNFQKSKTHKTTNSAADNIKALISRYNYVS
ncbi:hypothetical protein A79E_3890 [Klebsiella pneumoniae subsp. pneumoniae 1084]|nr:hypothetical protein A79E_3890 [Klebsiella pneumoniae subsp. pneumoniae 1084]